MKLKKVRRISALLLSMIFIFLMGTTAYAHEVPDIDKVCSVSFTILYGGTTPVSGGSMTVYRVGEIAEDNGDYRFEPTGDFAGCGVSFSDLTDKTLAGQLKTFADQHSTTGLATKDIDANGKVAFDGLKTGLYLIVQNKAAPGYKAIAPFLISLPYYDTVTGNYQYDLKVEPKTEIEKAPDTPPPPDNPPPDKPPQLPQTGQLWWPVPILVCGGLVLVVIGLVLTRRKKADES